MSIPTVILPKCVRSSPLSAKTFTVTAVLDTASTKPSKIPCCQSQDIAIPIMLVTRMENTT